MKNPHSKAKSRNIKILGSNKTLETGERGLCLKGNPATVANYHSLENDFSNLYFVRVGNHPLVGKYFEVISNLKGGDIQWK